MLDFLAFAYFHIIWYKNFTTYPDYVSSIHDSSRPDIDCADHFELFLLTLVGTYTAIFVLFLRCGAKRVFYSVYPFYRLFAKCVTY